MTDRLQVLAIGNAIVDVLARTDDAFLHEKGMVKGAMRLIDEAEAEEIYGQMGPATEVSGGAAANTAAGLAALGARVGFIGRVRNDQLGEVFTHDIRAQGVEYRTAPATDGLATARCFIFITPDGQRTMNTFLGASTRLTSGDLTPDQIARADVIYVEGYLWDAPEAKQAIRDAIGMAKAAGNRVAFTLSDSFCVDRHRAEFLALVRDHVDILFANEAEIKSLYQTDDAGAAAAQAARDCAIVAVTRSEHGAWVLAGNDRHAVPAVPGVTVVDTTGAGDLFAAGFLHGLTSGRSLADCGTLGCLCAAEIISHVGARPEADLKALAAAHLG
ncbi:adenosine kinase [Pedomonas sp. V897]|uniref:adenosine kinase n=1 Tax=Pedomonas sp. V897 TaxID=3446482 RepID=UPI003EE19541